MAENIGPLGNSLGEQVDEECFLWREVVVDGGQGDAGAAGDLAHGGAVVALLEKELQGGLTDAGAGVERVRRRPVDALRTLRI